MRIPKRLAPLLIAALLPAQQDHPAASPEDDARFFAAQVYPLLEKADCRACHNDNGVASATRLRFPKQDARVQAIEAFGLSLAALVDRGNPAESLLVRKPTLRVPHAGGERIGRDTPPEAALVAWARYLARLPEADLRAALERLAPPSGRAKAGAVRRLTHSQYNHTVRDLLGDFTRPADQFPQEDYLHGFTNQVEAQSIPPLLAEAYTTAAEKLAFTAFRRGDIHGLIPCQPAAAADAACRDRFIRAFGRRAFRRPLADREAAGYAALFDDAASGAEGFLAGARLVVESMLQSPAFLFHLEEGPGGRFPQYAIASRLSYFLWDTMPDEELFRAAEAGELGSSEAIAAAARRMLDDPRARRALEVFLAQWMRFDRVLGATRNARRYPDFGPSLLASMTEETKHLFNHLVWNDGNFMEMFSADYTFLSARLAQHYGLEAPPEDFAMVKYPASSTRAGVLGHAGFLTLTGSPAETSPTARGLFVREHFLCQGVPPPPPGVDANLPAIESPMTNRERLDIHLSNPSCAACHGLIDPIGFGLEGFDNVGRFRDKFVVRLQRQRDAVTNQPRPPETFELDMDTAGFIQGIPDSRFTNARELGNILANDPTCQRCMVKQIFRYALGRHENEADQPHLDSLFEGFRRSGFRFRQLVLALVTSPPFLGEPGTQRSAPARVASRPEPRP